MKDTENTKKSQDGRTWPKEKYSKRFAWNYILRMAMHREKYPYFPKKNYKWYVKDKDKAAPFKLERGMVGIKISELAVRWHWSRSKVIRFFKELIAEGRITLFAYRGQCTIITILDLEKEFKNKPK